ncbi:tetratricopeptide repeat protein [Pustulibacterium marinum]|uniref:tetratricopeptide repeat protein n=1 Tax=Pustulibacterium marinum TaxID=1224947 RepID=UPI0015A56770|nr:tetratricopeptide repeat protein [Pustulibacterium marinum]
MLISLISSAQSKEECDSIINIAVQEIFQKEDYASAINRLNEIKNIASKKRFQRQHFLAENNLGAAYYNMLDYGNAITHYLKAYEVAIENGDAMDEMTVLNNIAIVYVKDENAEKAKEYFEKSLLIAKKLQLPEKIALYASNLSKLNLEQGDTEKAKEFIQLTLKHPVKNPAVRLNAFSTQNKLLFQHQLFDSVIKVSNSALKESQKYQLHESASEFEYLIAKAYYEKGNYTKANEIVEQALNNAANDFYKLDLYELKSLLALKTNKINIIYATKDSLVAINNRINTNKNKEILVNSQLKFELAASNHELEINKEKTANQQLLYTISIVFLLIISLITIWAFYKRNEASKQKHILAEQNLKITDLELAQEKQKTELLDQELKEKELRNQLEKEKLKEKELQLKQEVAQSNKQLSDKILFQNTRNELIENIIAKVSDLPQIKKDSQLYKSINHLKLHLKEDTKWEEFTSNFENVNNEFILKLKKKHPNLNANDIRFLSFIYLNLSYKEIASLLNISPESCRKRKERVTKKMELSSGKSLFEYLSSL